MKSVLVFQAESTVAQAIPGARLFACFDEVGRGCLAGPVVAGCTLWRAGAPGTPLTTLLGAVDDSKKLSPAVRERVTREARALIPWSDSWDTHQTDLTAIDLASPHAKAFDFDTFPDAKGTASFRPLSGGLGLATSLEIDKHNIWRCVQLAMARAFALALCAAGLTDSDALAQGLVLIVDGKLGISVAPPFAGVPQVACVKGDGRFVGLGLSSIVAKVARDAYMTEQAATHPAYGFERHKGYGTAEHLAALRTHSPIPLHRLTFLRSLAGSPRF